LTKATHDYIWFRDWLLVTIGCDIDDVFFFFPIVVQPSLTGGDVVVESISSIFFWYGELVFFGVVKVASYLSTSSAQHEGGGEMRRAFLSILVSRVAEALKLYVPGSREVESLLFDWGTIFEWFRGVS
jgi:hypothetical protein